MSSEFARAAVADASLTGELDGFTNYGVSGSPGGGPYVELWLKVKEGKVVAATFHSNGCPSMQTAGATLAKICQGRAVENLLLMEPCDLGVLVGGFPEGKDYCGAMAVGALQAALGGAH